MTQRPSASAPNGVFISGTSEGISKANPWEPAYFLNFFHFRGNVYLCMRAHMRKVCNGRKCRKLRKYAGLRLVHARKFPRTTQGLPPPSRYYQRPKHKGNSDHVMLVVTNFFK
jgi:hypothetical protein